MKFTTFHVPPVYVLFVWIWDVPRLTHDFRINTKNVSSTYLRSESQTIWARNAAANAERKRTAEEAFAGKEKALPTDVSFSVRPEQLLVFDMD
jgi:hypothetical protein